MSQLNFARTSTLTLSLAAATTMAFGADTGLDLKITLESNEQATNTIANVAHYGTILSKSDDSTQITVRLDNPVEVESIVSKIKKYQDVSNIDVIQPTLPNQNLTALPYSELKKLVDDYKVSYDAWAVFNGQEREENANYPALGYLKAYLQYLEIRAYPNDEIDYSGHIDVANRRFAERQSATSGRESLNPNARGTITHLGNFGGGGGGGGGNPSTDGEWEFMGPTDLDVPLPNLLRDPPNLRSGQRHRLHPRRFRRALPRRSPRRSLEDRRRRRQLGTPHRRLATP